MSRLDKKIFDLRLAAKQITRDAKKLQKDEAREIRTCWLHVTRGQHDIGRVHAENAVRSYNQSLNLLKLGARLEGAVNILQIAAKQNRVSSAMNSVTLSMASAYRTANIPSLATAIDRFERMTDHLISRQSYTTETLNNGTVNTDQVSRLMDRIVDRARLDVKNEMPDATGSQTTSLPSPSPALAEAELDEKLAKLRNEFWSG